STLYIFAIDFRNLLIHIHLRIAKVAFQAYLRDSQVNLNQQITKLDRKNVQSRFSMNAFYNVYGHAVKLLLGWKNLCC
ncbi:MAG TPA: hypothetical protein VGO47_11760, partial [Chlamydiales bacterium]|nr:hypothetical protein [Chlamydiales bacterium]